MKGFLFDLDGVIADTASYHFAAWQKLVASHFQKSLPNKLEEATKGVSREDSLKVILNYLNISVTEDEFQKLLDEKNQLYIASLEGLNEGAILPGICQLLEDIKQDGGKIALASASKNATVILQKLGILDKFDAIVDPNDIQNGKPAPDIFLAAADALNLASKDCIGIEDSIAGVDAINQAGAYSVAVGSGNFNSAKKVVRTTSDLRYEELKNI